jgi:hypothetical protein
MRNAATAGVLSFDQLPRSHHRRLRQVVSRLLTGAYAAAELLRLVRSVFSDGAPNGVRQDASHADNRVRDIAGSTDSINFTFALDVERRRCAYLGRQNDWAKQWRRAG